MSRAVLIHTGEVKAWRKRVVADRRGFTESGDESTRSRRLKTTALVVKIRLYWKCCVLSPWKPLKVVTSCMVSACSDCFSGVSPPPPPTPPPIMLRHLRWSLFWVDCNQDFVSVGPVMREEKKPCLKRRHLPNSLDKSWGPVLSEDDSSRSAHRFTCRLAHGGRSARPWGATVQLPLQGQGQSTARAELPARLGKDAAADLVMNPADCLVGASY